MIKKLLPEEPIFNRRELLRYAGIKNETEEIRCMVDECILQARPLLSYRVCYDRFSVDREGEKLCFSSIISDSRTLSKALNDCDEMILFAATVGSEFDRLTMKYSRVSPSKAVILQALGAERVESLCDAFCEQMRSELQLENKSLRTRVSPGYGDIPLLMQKDIFSLLDCPRKIGLTLNENLMMSPSKSVTAIMGICRSSVTEEEKCRSCEKTDCRYRKEV